MTLMRASELRRLQATAHHEAGHATVAFWLGLKFKYVTIKPGATTVQVGHYRDVPCGTLGHVLHRFPKWFKTGGEISWRVRLLGERHIITSFAGQLAEEKFLGRRPRGGMHQDNQSAVDMAFHLFVHPEVTQAYLKFCMAAARADVERYWREIEAVATALLEQETLSYDQTRAAICAAVKARKA